MNQAAVAEHDAAAIPKTSSKAALGPSDDCIRVVIMRTGKSIGLRIVGHGPTRQPRTGTGSSSSWNAYMDCLHTP